MSQESGPPEGSRSSPNDRMLVNSEEDQITQALEEYARLRREGRPVRREDFLASHESIAAALAECLDGLELVEDAASEFTRAWRRAFRPWIERRPSSWESFGSFARSAVAGWVSSSRPSRFRAVDGSRSRFFSRRRLSAHAIAVAFRPRLRRPVCCGTSTSCRCWEWDSMPVFTTT